VQSGWSLPEKKKFCERLRHPPVDQSVKIVPEEKKKMEEAKREGSRIVEEKNLALRPQLERRGGRGPAGDKLLLFSERK